MKYLIKYLLQQNIRSQKYLAPVVFYTIVMLLMYSYKPNPVADSYGVTAMLLFFGSAWLGLTVMNAEPPGQIQLLVLHAGSRRKVAIGQLISAVVMQLAMALITIVYPIVTGMFDRQPSANEWIVAWCGHLVLALLGLSISVFFQNAYISRLSRSLPIFIVVLLSSFVQISLSEKLPESLQWMSYILPPAFYLVQKMMLYDGGGLGQIILVCTWSAVYAMLLLSIHIWLSGRRDLRS